MEHGRFGYFDRHLVEFPERVRLDKTQERALVRDRLGERVDETLVHVENALGTFGIGEQIVVSKS